MRREVRGVGLECEIDGGVDGLEEIPVGALVGLRDVLGVVEGLVGEGFFCLGL
jgi:hypothetical protein